MATPKRWITTCVAMISLAAICGQARAQLLDNIITNPFAFFDGSTTWQGVRHVTQNLGSLGTVDANLSFSVFAPGDFQDFLDLNTIAYVDPEPTRYIYAYQVEIISATYFNVPSGATFFTVGRDGDEILIGPAPSWVPGTGDQSPTTATPSAYQGTSYLWNFNALLNGGEFSDILYFASPTKPGWDNGVVNVGLASGQTLGADAPDDGGLPSPLPEPTTMSLALLLGAGLLAGRRR